MIIRSTSFTISALLSLAAGCAGTGTTEGKRPNDAEESRVTGAVSALQSAMAACVQQLSACEGAADASTTADCQDRFSSCRGTAQADLGPAMDQAVSDCAEVSRSCRQAAATSDAKQACSDQLKSCVGDDKPTSNEHPDAGAEHAPGSPVAGCISALRSCLEGDAPARECTGPLHSCVMAAVGAAQDAGKPDQPGDAHDAGKPDDTDAAGKPEHPDAGSAGDEDPAADAGTRAEPDAGDSSEATACKAAYEQCVAGGDSRDVCARANKDCRD